MSKRLLRILIALLLLDLIGFGVLWYGYSLLGTKKNEEMNLQKQIASEQQKGGQIASLRKTLKQAEKENAALANYFYSQGEETQIDFVAQMETLGGKTSGAQIETKSLDLVAGSRLSFHGEFGITGTWGEAYHFLRLVETFPARIIINRLTLGTTETTKDLGAATWKGGISIDLVSVKS